MQHGQNLENQNAETKQLYGAAVLFGLGQQGKRVVQKLVNLREDGHKVDLTAVFDPNPAKFEEEIVPGKRLADIFPDTKRIVGTIRDAPFDMKGITVVFDCSNTVSDGVENHTANMEAVVQNGFRGTSWSGRDWFRTYAVEKPTSLDGERLKRLVMVMRKRKIALTTDYVESFTPAKSATIKDIAQHSRKVTSIKTFRLSSTQEKSVKTKRLVIRHNSGAWADKAHDPMHAAMVIAASHGDIRYARVVKADFQMLEIISPNGIKSYIAKDGRFVPGEGEAKNLQGFNDAHANVAWSASGVTVRHVSSHLGAKPEDLREIEGWFTPNLKHAVAEASTKRGEPRTPASVTAAYGANFQNLEARVAKIECSDGTAYVEQTYGAPGGHFSARINPDGTVDILFEGPPPDGMMKWVWNAFAASVGVEKPAFTMAEILKDNEIIQLASWAANRDTTWTLDLGDPQQEAFAKFLEKPLREANCW
ncbi:MAG: hypothetical protein HYS87_03440 [Candidatus Colwellbacteria bacterium]|nr:hypothetical protein [Candidatus Colwellbacteria bacterium]